MTRLELERRKRGIKQIQFAKLIGLSATYISAVERLLVRPSNNFRRKVSSALKLPEELLFSDTNKLWASSCKCRMLRKLNQKG